MKCCLSGDIRYVDRDGRAIHPIFHIFERKSKSGALREARREIRSEIKGINKVRGARLTRKYPAKVRAKLEIGIEKKKAVRVKI